MVFLLNLNCKLKIIHLNQRFCKIIITLENNMQLHVFLNSCIDVCHTSTAKCRDHTKSWCLHCTKYMHFCKNMPTEGSRVVHIVIRLYQYFTVTCVYNSRGNNSYSVLNYYYYNSLPGDLRSASSLSSCLNKLKLMLQLNNR